MKNIPRQMSAVEISEPGGPDKLQLRTRPTPELRDNEVLIKVEAAGVNRPDIMQRSGLYPPPAGASDIPGLEVAGTVVKIQNENEKWKVGDKVCALVNGGGYAQYVNVPNSQCLSIPDNLSWVESASLPETYFTVWINVFQRSKLRAGESILVQGGGSGIGVAAIQLASSRGSDVFVTAGTDEKCQKCEALGAKIAINYKKTNFKSVILEKTAGRGVDVILDMVAGDYVGEEIDCLANDGRLAIIALMGGVRAELNLTKVMTKRLSISGSTLRPRSDSFKAEITSQLEAQVWPSISSGEIKPVVDKIFQFDKASLAHEYLESGNHFGKIMLAF